MESTLRRGKSTRCAKCARRKAGTARKKYWGYADIVADDAHRRRLLNRISACLTRCKPTGHANYGGRGIRVYEPWTHSTEGRRAFLAYVVTLEGWDRPKLDLDRIRTDGDYEPGNLRFITRKANNANKRSIRELQALVTLYESCLRHCTCGATESVHNQNG
jgi:hypothetical protein